MPLNSGPRWFPMALSRRGARPNWPASSSATRPIRVNTDIFFWILFEVRKLISKPQIKLTIEKLNSKGDGLARHEGKVCFIPWGVPGDEVIAQIEKEHKDFDDARIIKITKKSPDRVEPRCPYFYKCGGCQLQHLNYEAQLRSKHEIVLDALKRIARISEPPLRPVIPSPRIWQYRTRLRLHQDREGKIGLYERESHRVVPIDACMIAEDGINRMISELHANSDRPNQTGELELRMDQSKAFTQINPKQNERLIEVVMGFLGTEQNVFDLYCGNGNFTLPASKQSTHVWGIEKNSSALREAKERGEVSNISWVHASVVRGINGLREKGINSDAMIANPPRRGLDEVLEAIIPLKPKKIIYVSCVPATFARDSSHLIKSGYILKTCQPIDMFPQTVHVELVGEFTNS